MAASSQRRALGALFLVLAIAFAGFAYTAGVAHVWVVAGAGGVLALWMLQLSWQMLRRSTRR